MKPAQETERAFSAQKGEKTCYDVLIRLKQQQEKHL